MNTAKIVRCLAVCMLMLALPVAASPAQQNTMAFDAMQKASNVPGMSAAIMKDGRVVWQGNVGYADVANKVPVSARTRFRLASVSKFVTTLMLARLVEQGRIDLAAPISRYVPEFPAKAYRLTGLQLASHISGMPHYDAKLDANRDGFPAPFNNVSAGLAIFKDRPLVHAPGTAFLYSSFGFNLLAAGMERAARQDFLSQIATLATTARAPSLEAELLHSDRTHWSQLYEVGGKEVPRGNITYNWAGGGMLSNATDLARVGVLALDTSFISPKTLAMFTTPLRLANGAVVESDGYTMGIGWRLNTDQHGRRYFHHSGATRGARSHISVYPEQKLVVAILSNASWTSAMEMTAMSLAEPMFGDVDGTACEARRFAYDGAFKEKAIRGDVRFEPVDGHCKAIFEADNSFGAWLANGSGVTSFTMVGRGGRLALVGKTGLFPVTRQGASMTITVKGNPVVLALSVR